MVEGKAIYNIAEEIYPIFRSLSGDGVRQTLKILKSHCKELNIIEIPSGTKAFDWTVPKEWNISEAYIENEDGERIIDIKNHNLHVMGYSIPVDQYVSKEELLSYIYVEEDQPDAIPYVTSYYEERFGFCMTKNQRDSLLDETYHMVIKSTLEDGFLTLGEIIIPGETKEEILFSTYICHPSMANNECSGPALAVYLADWLKRKKNRRYTYRIIFIPETIGSITYLSQNLEYLKEHLLGGFVLSCVGDNMAYSMVETRYGNTIIDRVLKNILSFHAPDYHRYSYLYRGSDERQYNAPGVDLSVCGFCRSKYEEFPEYHTSLDDMQLVSEEGFQGSFEVITQCIDALEANYVYQVTCLCEPQLGKRGLYPTVSKKGSYDEIKTMSHLIAYSDGTNDLIDISDRIKIPVSRLITIARNLEENGVLKKHFF